MVKQIFYLGYKRLSDILTPRTQLIVIDLEDSFEENMKIINESHYSKFPVGIGSLDDFQGIIHKKDLLTKIVAGDDYSLADCVKDTPILPEQKKRSLMAGRWSCFN